VELNRPRRVQNSGNAPLRDVSLSHEGQAHQTATGIRDHRRLAALHGAPPKVSAALYHAAAKIPGVTLVRHATDITGRHGVAVAMAGPKNCIRTEWIFDPKSLTFLGESNVEIKASHGFAAGETTSGSAVLKRGVVDRSGQLPH
jgi:hypothetical protein